MKQSPYLKPLFWTLLIFALVVCLIITLLYPLPGLLLLFLICLALLLVILLKPGFWDRVRPGWRLRRRRKKGDDDEVPEVERTFHPVMMLESCAEGSTEMIKITSPEFTLGRMGDNDHVFVNDRNISRHHARIIYREETKFYYIEDLGSQNGTFVNARRLSPRTPVLLKEKTVVAFGQYRYIFHRIGK